MASNNIIAYMRVSTKRQGLGLDAQRETITAYAAAHGCRIIAEYSEKESGKETLNRPALQDAIKHAISMKATLVVAKLDRLSRDVADIFSLKKRKGLSIEICDMDASDTMMLGIFATLAQKERELISERTKAVHAAKKARKMELLQKAAQTNDASLAAALRTEAETIKEPGNPNAREHMTAINHMGTEARKAKADNDPNNRHAYHAIANMSGSLQAKADFLNREGYVTRTGKRFTRMQVSRLIARFS